MEAPDEAGHRHEVENKVLSIEKIDREVIGYLLEKMAGEPFRMLVLPDHPTPLAIRTHASDPVPFLLFDSREAEAGCERYTELLASATGHHYSSGPSLMEMFLAK